MRTLYVSLAVACLAGVLAINGSDYLRSLTDLRAQVERYAFDGERYLLEANAAAPTDLAGGLPVLASARQLSTTPLPFLAHVRGAEEPIVVLDVDRTYVKAYEPGVGVVLYLRRVLEPRLVPEPAGSAPWPGAANGQQVGAR